MENWLKIAVFYVLVVSTVRNEEQMQFLVVAFLVVMALYVGHSYREFLCGRHRYAMGVARMVGVDAAMNDPNTFGATILYALPMVYPLWYEARKRWQKLLLIGFVLLACGCILLTGSRSAFVRMYLALGGNLVFQTSLHSCHRHCHRSPANMVEFAGRP